jgi:hypothetical protein
MPILQTYRSIEIPLADALFTIGAEREGEYQIGRNVRISPDGSTLAVVTDYSWGTVNIYDKQGNGTWLFYGSVHVITNSDTQEGTYGKSLSFNTNGSVLMISVADFEANNYGSVFVYTRTNGGQHSLSRTMPLNRAWGKPANSYYGHAAAMSPDGKFAYISDRLGNVHKWNGANPSTLERVDQSNYNSLTDTIEMNNSRVFFGQPEYSGDQGRVYHRTFASTTSAFRHAPQILNGGRYGEVIAPALNANLVYIANGHRVVRTTVEISYWYERDAGLGHILSMATSADGTRTIVTSATGAKVFDTSSNSTMALIEDLEVPNVPALSAESCFMSADGLICGVGVPGLSAQNPGGVQIFNLT